MAELYEAMKKFFTEDEWPFAPIEGQTALSTGFKGENGSWNCYARGREDAEQFLFYSICPISIPEEKRLAMAEFLTRANYGLNIGNFELDLSDGEIRYKTSIDVENDRLNSALIKNMVYANVLTMDHYLPGIMSVIYGDASPLEAISQVEGSAALPQASQTRVVGDNGREDGVESAEESS